VPAKAGNGRQKTEDRRQNADDRRQNRIRVQDIGRPGNQDTLQIVRGFAPYAHTKCFQTRIYADLHRVGVVILFLSIILDKSALFFSKQSQFAGGAKFR